MLYTFEWFRKRVSELVISFTVDQLDFVHLDAFSHEMVLDIDMLGSLIYSRIISEVNSAGVINTISYWIRILEESYIAN